MTTGQTAALQTYRTARAGYALLFTWQGAYYVTVCINGVESHSINVWDYSTGEARVPFSGAGLKRAALEWLTDTTESELHSYLVQAAAQR